MTRCKAWGKVVVPLSSWLCNVLSGQGLRCTWMVTWKEYKYYGSASFFCIPYVLSSFWILTMVRTGVQNKANRAHDPYMGSYSSQRKRVPVAVSYSQYQQIVTLTRDLPQCLRCRKLKARCSGDDDNGTPCRRCALSDIAEPCRFPRVSSWNLQWWFIAIDIFRFPRAYKRRLLAISRPTPN